MPHWSERVEAILKEKGMDLGELATLANVPYNTLYKAARRRTDAPRAGLLGRVATALGTTEMALRFGASNLHGIRKIPLLDMNRMGTISARSNIKTAWDGESVVSVSGDFSDEAFAVVVIDDSCYPEFAIGDVVICDPHEPVIPGKFVVATVTGISHGLIRRYRQLDPLDLTTGILVPVNTDFPEITISRDRPGIIIGRAVAHQRKL